MATETIYQYLASPLDDGSGEMHVRDTGIRASTIWHDRYVSRLTPDQIAIDREISLEAVYEALAYCQEEWESICRERESERQQLESIGFFEDHSSELR